VSRFEGLALVLCGSGSSPKSSVVEPKLFVYVLARTTASNCEHIFFEIIYTLVNFLDLTTELGALAFFMLASAKQKSSRARRKTEASRAKEKRADLLPLSHSTGNPFPEPKATKQAEKQVSGARCRLK
jgi:hypothetical protein